MQHFIGIWTALGRSPNERNKQAISSPGNHACSRRDYAAVNTHENKLQICIIIDYL
jgi:hypothetical protein